MPTSRTEATSREGGASDHSRRNWYSLALVIVLSRLATLAFLPGLSGDLNETGQAAR